MKIIQLFLNGGNDMLGDSLKWMFLIIGTTIGAGYASGQELWQFFGHGSGLAIFLFTLFFGVSCVVIMSISYQHQSTHYSSVLQAIVGKRFSGIYDIMIFIYLYSVTVVMIAGSGATAQNFHVSYWWGVFLIVIALIVLFIKGINGLLAINQYVVPSLIGGLLFFLLLFTFNENLSLFSHWYEQHNWLAAFPFSALNILPLIAVLGAVGHKVRSKREIWIACVGSSSILGVITYVYNNSLIYISDQLLIYEIPLFAILKGYSLELITFMTMLLWLAIYTTAAANILGIVTRLQAFTKTSTWLLATYLLLTMVPLTVFGFSTLITYIYPAYGLLNLYVLVRLLLYPVW